MKKKIIIGLSILLVTILTSAVCLALNGSIMDKKEKPSDYNIGVNYETAMESEKPALVLFYADWCGYCLKFMPKFQTISSIYKDKFSIVMLNVEDPQYKKVVDDIALTGFPTLYIIDSKYDNRVLLNNALYLDLKRLRGELDRYLGIRKRLDDCDKCTEK